MAGPGRVAAAPPKVQPGPSPNKWPQSFLQGQGLSAQTEHPPTQAVPDAREQHRKLLGDPMLHLKNLKPFCNRLVSVLRSQGHFISAGRLKSVILFDAPSSQTQDLDLAAGNPQFRRGVSQHVSQPDTADIERRGWVISKGHKPLALTTVTWILRPRMPLGVFSPGCVTSQGCPRVQLRSRGCPARGGKGEAPRPGPHILTSHPRHSLVARTHQGSPQQLREPEGCRAPQYPESSSHPGHRGVF